MTGMSHAAVGVTGGIILSDKLNINPVICIGLCTLGSLIVDIDAESSLINKLIIPVTNRKHGLNKLANAIKNNKNIIKIIIGTLLQFNTYTLVKYIGFILILSSICSKIAVKFSLFGGIQVNNYHRTIFHDPVLGTLLLTFPLYIYRVPNWYLIPYITGIFLHYLLDSFTHAGLYSIVLHKFFRMPLHFKSGNILVEFILISCCGIYLVCTKSLYFLF